MIMVKITPWGSLNLQYLEVGVAGQKKLGNSDLDGNMEMLLGQTEINTIDS